MVPDCSCKVVGCDLTCWKMALRGLNPEMIVNLCDVMEKNFFEMTA